MHHHHLSSTKNQQSPLLASNVGDLLSDLPTPSLLLELSLAENAIKNNNKNDTPSLDEMLLLGNKEQQQLVLEGAIFVHTKLIDTSKRDEITNQQGSGSSIVIGQVDAPFVPSYLGIGLANHHAGGYYWARGMGIGASLPAHGISLNTNSELYWKKRGPGSDATETTEESSNSNDGKRSEWADFLVVGDTVQLVPLDIQEVLVASSANVFDELLGVRRIGRPLGADPIVEQVWIRDGKNGWVSKQ